MTTRGWAYAEQYAAVNDELIAAIEGWPDERWGTSTASEGWPVGVVAQHVATTAVAFAGILDRFAAGDRYTPSVTLEQINQLNAEHARDNAGIARREVLHALRTTGDAIITALRALDDAQFERVGGTFGGNDLTIGQVVEMVVIGHARQHLASIQATR